MKLRRIVLLPALVLLLAFPATADPRSRPTVEGPPPAAIEGTISSLHAPIAGGGPIVSILDGLVWFDATGATVRFGDGTPGTTDDLAAGQRVVAFVDATASPLKASAIVVLLQRTDVTLTGKVEAVDPPARTLTVLGFTVTVTEATVFGGPRDGTGQAGLEDVKVGDLVLVAAKADSGRLVATRVMKLSPSPTPTVRLHGVVESIGTEAWTLLLRDGTSAVVKVDAETKVVGEPRAGDEVDVLARRLSDGSLLAILIAKVATTPSPVATVSFDGVVQRISPGSPTGTWLVGETKVVVSRATTVRGNPQVGDTVHVEGLKSPDRVVLARLVAKL